MWLCHRLFWTGLCARSAILVTGAKSCSTAICGWERSRCISFGKTSVKGKPVKVMKVRFISTKHNTEASEQSSTLVLILKWGVVSFLTTTVVSTTVVWWELCSLKHSMSDVMSSLSGTQAETPGPALPMYPWQITSNQHSTASNENDFGVWFPWLRSKSQDPFTLLELCRSKNPTVRRLGIKALAAKTAWEDYQYRYVAQAADYRTLIGLSRSQHADARFFLQQPSLVSTKTPVVEELASVLLMLDQHQRGDNSNNYKGSSQNSRAAVLAYQYLQQKQRPTDDKIRFWGFDGSSLDVASVDDQPLEDHLLLQFLSAVAQLCCNPEQASLFIRGDGLAVLQRVTEQYENTETFTAVASVLGNLALHASSHENMVHTGWLGVLKSWTGGQNSKLAVNAARALANMDREWSCEVLDDGVVILHPLYRSRKTVHADIVFVHGLLGGAVKTWRQQNTAVSSPYNNTPYTDCWPKDWLAEDCPHVRIISVHYDTVLSSWSSSADNNNKEKCTLEGRSRELLDKLHKTGVGKRPVIWVGHSMGGLLIKQMLELCELCQKHNSMKQQTCGLLLYSVPHHGLSIAAFSNQIHYLLYPSIEVQELKPDSPHLTRLHGHFKQFVENNSIPCLSFGEQNKTLLAKTLPKVLLVPPQSSDPGVGEFCPLPLNHINICKPDSRESDLYQQTLSFVHRCIVFSYVHRIRKGVTGSLD